MQSNGRSFRPIYTSNVHEEQLYPKTPSAMTWKSASSIYTSREMVF